MGDKAQQSAVPNVPPASNSNNPYGQASNPNDPQNASLGNSVVRDLMRVYESLTQSSTPQFTPDDTNKASEAGAGYDHQSTPPIPPGQPGMPTTYPIPPPVFHMPGETQYPPQQQQQSAIQQMGSMHQPYAAYSQHYMVSHGDQPGYPSQHPSDDHIGEAADVEGPQDSGRLRKKRKDTDSTNVRGQKGRKKSKSTDGRWSKRFTWPEDLHRDFVSAIFDVGLKHSSPSTILEHMPKHEHITTERIKSHLQKYRLHRVKSKKEFVSSYESSLRNFQQQGLGGMKTISGGGVAAHLTYSDMGGNKKSDSLTKTKPTSENGPSTAGAARPTESQTSEALMLPQLTETEKSSPIGASMGYLMGLFFSLKQQLMAQRALKIAESNKVNAPVKDVFDSFVAGGTPAGGSAPDNNADGQPLKPAAQSVRTNIEENSMMKREMQNQMELQNKMRALKQQELNKYRGVPMHSGHEKAALASSQIGQGEEPAELLASHIQGAGEREGHDGALEHHRGRPRTLSMGASEDFWNTDVVDEQLFEFLMNN